MPPVDWSWDWHFSILATMDINAEFALRFQFRIFEKTPYTAVGFTGGARDVSDKLASNSKPGDVYDF
ncbi:MAG: hypothetical protein BYD32DRAFT_461940 [Podila humilis]|nr:MAG: hypothetical protein BYD32DRAFT_461940 [Podila humilis]